MTTTFRREDLRKQSDSFSHSSGVMLDDDPDLQASLLHPDHEQPIAPPSCWGRCWTRIKNNGYKRTLAGLSFLATGITTVVMKILNYREWNDQPVACTALSTTLGVSVHGTVECLTQLNVRRLVRQVYKDYSLPAFWWFSQFFIITAAADDWHEGFRVCLLYSGGTFIANKLFESLDNFVAGADRLKDTLFARNGTRKILFTRTGTIVIESAKVGTGAGLIAASFFTDVPYPGFCLYTGTFLASSPLGMALRLGFKRLCQLRQSKWEERRHSLEDPLPRDVKALRITGRICDDWWTTIMGGNIAAGSLVSLPPTYVAILWGLNGVLFFGATESALEEFEDVPISPPSPYSPACQDRQWYLHRGLALGGTVYVIALMATNPWPNQLVLGGYMLGAFGKYLLIRMAEIGYDPLQSSPYIRYLRFNTHHRSLIFTIPFYLFESHMNTGSTAINHYYERGRWDRIAAATVSWASYGSTFVGPIPAEAIQPAVISEATRFLVKALGGAV